MPFPCRTILLALCGLAFALAARAELSACTTSVAGVAVPLFYDPSDPRVLENTTRREALLGDCGGITCPGFVTLRYLTPDLTDDQRGTFCLRYDRSVDTYTGYSAGERNAFAICRTPTKGFCERVNDSRPAALAITRFAADLTGLGTVADMAEDVSVLTQDNGAVTVSGSGAEVAAALARIGTTAVTVAAAPAQLGAAAVTVVAVGGIVYACRD